MLNQFSRTELLFGKDGMEKLNHARVAVFGIGRKVSQDCPLQGIFSVCSQLENNRALPLS